MADDDGPTPVTLPSSLPYPITVSRIIANPPITLARGSSLFEYTFTSSTSAKALARRAKGLPAQPEDKDAKEGDMVGTWDSELQGELVSWEGWLKVGLVVERTQVGKTAVHIQQPCDHSIQFGGMCAKCGEPLNNDDYLSRPEETQAGPSKKTFEMSHDALGVTVSTNEAKRLENQSRDLLLSSRKLSLIVDLDQTIIHTTVDSTVGEWMAEIERDKAKSTANKNADSTTPPGSPLAKEGNPFEEALRDVAKFEITDDLPAGYAKNRPQAPTSMDRWYYTKPRPGVQKFLQHMNEKYEMHVYTMGTRTYANAICKVVDPTGAFFGHRILSRDESGSFSAKDLKRLFPTDQSMVVIIDDRSDVWNDVPNLVKVVPYSFFQGTGDVNSAFLPPLPKADTSSPVKQTSGGADEVAGVTVTEETKIAQAKMLDEQSSEKKLAKLQAELDAEQNVTGSDSEESDVGQPSTNGTSDTTADAAKREERSTTPPASPPRVRKTVLNLVDDELDRVADILSRIHRTFYVAYDGRRDKSATARLPLDCDVTASDALQVSSSANDQSIIPEMKAGVLDGCRIVFSGIIPRHIRPQQSTEWRQAEAFGAECQLDIESSTTHCVIKSEGTEKALRAQRMAIRVVFWTWFEECVSLWRRVDEKPYLVQRHRNGDRGVESRAPSGPTTPQVKGLQLNADEEVDASGANGSQEGYLNRVDSVVFDPSTFDDDDDFLASIRAEAGIGDDESDFGGTEDAASRHVPSSPPKSILASPRNSRAGSIESDDGSQPGTPRKRVRYADEESLPLENFKDPSPDSVGSPPRKRPRALLMPPEEDSVPDANKFQWKGKMASTTQDVENGELGDKTELAETDRSSVADDDPSEAGTEEDELAAMLRESMEDGEA